VTYLKVWLWATSGSEEGMTRETCTVGQGTRLA